MERYEEGETSKRETTEIRNEEDDMMKLYEASVRGYLPTLNELIQKDPLLNNISLMSFRKSLLHISTSLGHLDFTKALLNYKPKLATELDSHNRSALHLTSAEGHTEIVKALVDVNKDVCLIADEEGRIPLHYAAMRGCIEVIQLLISNWPKSIRVKAKRERTVLEALKLLVEYVNDNSEFLNSKDHDDGNTILHLAMMLKQVETTEYSLSRPEIQKNANNGIGSTVIEWLKNKITKWIGSLRYSADWSDKTRDALMLVSTVITSATFQCAINPPGGVWQDYKYVHSYKNSTTNTTIYRYLDTSNASDDAIFQFLKRDASNGTKHLLEAGMAVLAYFYKDDYFDFFVKNTICFIASLCVIILLVSGVPLSNKLWSWMLTIGMTLTLVFLGLAYQRAVWLVTPYHLIEDVALYNNRSFRIMMCCLAMFAGFNTLRFAISVYKNLRKKYFKCKKASTYREPTQSAIAVLDDGIA